MRMLDGRSGTPLCLSTRCRSDSGGIGNAGGQSKSQAGKPGWQTTEPVGPFLKAASAKKIAQFRLTLFSRECHQVTSQIFVAVSPVPDTFLVPFRFRASRLLTHFAKNNAAAPTLAVKSTKTSRISPFGAAG